MKLANSTPDALTKTLGSFPQLAADWPGGAWIWEDRFTCAVSVIELAQAPDVRARVMAQLPKIFTSEHTSALPIPVERCVHRAGGLRSGQLVFWGDHIGDAVPYSLWWPWANGANISVRIGLASL